MKHILYYIAAWLLASFAVSCENDDTDFSNIIGKTDTVVVDTDTIVVPPIEVKSIEIDSTALEEAADVVPTAETDPTYGDYVENAEFKHTIYINFSETGDAQVTGATSKVSATVTGNHVVIKTATKKIEYILTGASSNGSLKIYSENKFKLMLNGVTLTNPNGAAINNQCGKTLYLVVADGTTNRLEDGSTYADVANEDMKGTLFSEGQIIVSGKGTLNVIANGRNAIASDDYLRIRPGVRLYAKALMRNGIKTNDGVWIDGGVINIETTASGAKGINCEANVAIAGGRTTIIGSGGVIVEQGDTTSCAGVKCDSTLTMTGGTLNIKMTGEGAKGINVNGNFAFDGGELNIVTTGEKGLASPKGVKCDGAMSITAGSFYVYSTNAAALDVAGTFTLAEGYKSKETGPHYYVVIF